jgi:hypothetical protein
MKGLASFDESVADRSSARSLRWAYLCTNAVKSGFLYLPLASPGIGPGCCPLPLPVLGNNMTPVEKSKMRAGPC